MKTICNVAVLPVLLVALIAMGCRRPFEEPTRPRIDVISPDLSVIQTDPQFQIALRVTSPINIEHVVAGRDTLTYDEDQNVWRGRQVLTNALNRIVVAITDADMRTTRDTLYAMVHIVMVSRTGPHLPASRGYHTATRLDDGRIVLLGGSAEPAGRALATGLVLDRAADAFVELGATLNTARAGHTATLLPDGRILIVGGSERGEVRMMEDLIGSVEVYDPTTQAFSVLPVTGEPIRRAFHTATLHLEGGEVFVDLYGGVGDVSYRPPILGTRADVRRFRVEEEALVALDPAPGPELRHRLAGHAQVELYPSVLANRRFYISGARFDGDEDNVSFELEYHPQLGLLPNAVGPLHEARTHHAAVLLQDGFVGIFGGRKGSAAEAQNITEIYSSIVRMPFRYPEPAATLARFGHTATKIENDRIRIFGGFGPAGGGLVTSELHRMPDFRQGLTGFR